MADTEEQRRESEWRGMVLERLNTAVAGIGIANTKIDRLASDSADHEFRIQVLERARKAAENDRRFFWTGVLALAAAAVATVRLLLGK